MSRGAQAFFRRGIQRKYDIMEKNAGSTRMGAKASLQDASTRSRLADYEGALNPFRRGLLGAQARQTNAKAGYIAGPQSREAEARAGLFGAQAEAVPIDTASAAGLRSAQAGSFRAGTALQGAELEEAQALIDALGQLNSGQLGMLLGR